MEPLSRSAETALSPAPTSYLVEQYWPGITVEVFRSATKRVRTVANAMRRGGTPIRYRRSTLIPADEAALCVIEATSAELIEQLYLRAGVRFDRIVAALEI